ncbi:MAG: helix-turn-helix transcriptional regulator [Bacteriovoracaceae bacterium]|nr:helix-turn-helix transcriptional regulator [Bacteriovoracaceae bacterium]
MEAKKRTNSDKKDLLSLGVRIRSLIQLNGYASPYEFWLEHGDECISRSNLNYLINGQTDPKLTTILKLSAALGLSPSELLQDF